MIMWHGYAQCTNSTIQTCHNAIASNPMKAQTPRMVSCHTVSMNKTTHTKSWRHIMNGNTPERADFFTGESHTVKKSRRGKARRSDKPASAHKTKLIILRDLQSQS